VVSIIHNESPIDNSNFTRLITRDSIPATEKCDWSSFKGGAALSRAARNYVTLRSSDANINIGIITPQNNSRRNNDAEYDI
jgi:hypothetical protein